jgi:hypothetical protein
MMVQVEFYKSSGWWTETFIDRYSAIWDVAHTRVDYALLGETRITPDMARAAIGDDFVDGHRPFVDFMPRRESWGGVTWAALEPHPYLMCTLGGEESLRYTRVTGY